MIQVYTGNGKGKTTAAFGQALRASGQGLTVCIIQFLKGDEHFGEIQAAKNLRGVTVEQYGQKEFIRADSLQPQDRELAHKGLLRAEEIVAGCRCDMLILDEINLALAWGLVPLEEVLHLLNSAPPEMEIILTGRHAPSEILSRADLITEMQERKHYYQKGICARRGTEY